MAPDPTAVPARVRAVLDRRSSHAAGPHGTERTRAELLAAALDDYADDLGTHIVSSDGPEAA